MITDVVHRLDQFLIGIGSYAQYVDDINIDSRPQKLVAHVCFTKTDSNPEIDIWIYENTYDVIWDDGNEKSLLQQRELQELSDLVIKLLEGRNG